jgi:hypothetical protein
MRVGLRPRQEVSQLPRPKTKATWVKTCRGATATTTRKHMKESKSASIPSSSEEATHGQGRPARDPQPWRTSDVLIEPCTDTIARDASGATVSINHTIAIGWGDTAENISQFDDFGTFPEMTQSKRV